MNNVLQTICDALANKKCVNTKVLDVRELTTIADYFFLTSARNKKNTQAAADEVEEKLKETGIIAIRKEGYNEGDWILLVFGDILVHIFIDDERRRFDFDTLWKDAPAEEFHEAEVPENDAQ